MYISKFLPVMFVFQNQVVYVLCQKARPVFVGGACPPLRASWQNEID